MRLYINFFAGLRISNFNIDIKLQIFLVDLSKNIYHTCYFKRLMFLVIIKNKILHKIHLSIKITFDLNKFITLSLNLFKTYN